MPVTEMNFPAITICKQGFDLAAVSKAVDRDYRIWKKNQKRKKRDILGNEDGALDIFLKEMY